MLNDDDRDITLQFLQPDLECLIAAREASEGNDPNPGILRMLEQIKKVPPRLHGTYGRIQRMIGRKLEDDHPVHKMLEALRLRTLEIAELLKKRVIGEEERAEPAGWIDP